MIMRAQARRAVVFSSCRERGAVKGVDGATIIGRDGDVHDAGEAAFAPDPEVRLAVLAETRSRASAFGMVAPHFHDQRVAERGQRLFVESLGTRIVGNGKANVIDHGSLLLLRADTREMRRVPVSSAEATQSQTTLSVF